MKNTSKLLAFLALTGNAWPAEYTFTKIADTGPNSGLIGMFPSFAINESGRVAFAAATAISGGQVSEVTVFTGAGGALTRIADTKGDFGQLAVGGINSNGIVAFFAADKSRQRGIFTGSGGTLNTIAIDSVDRPVLAITPDISEDNQVSFRTASRIFVSSNGSIRTAVDTRAAPFRDTPLLSCHQWNGKGDLVFVAVDSLNLQTGGVFSERVGKVTAIETDAGSLTFFPGTACSMNDAGTATFFAYADAGLWPGIFTATAGGRPASVFSNGVGAATGFVGIDSQGKVVFATEVQGGRGSNAIIAGSDPQRDKVIAVGDELFGARVTGISLKSDSSGRFVNSKGQIAFIYQLANGLGGVAVASPVGQPANGAGPVVPANAIVNAASLAALANPSPGSVVSIFGSGLATGLVVADGPSLPTSLGGVSVTFDGLTAPLYFVSPGQINAQVPFELTGATAQVVVNNSGSRSEPRSLTLALLDPAIYSLGQAGPGQGAILIANSTVVAGPVGSVPGARPARPGESIVIYANGLGAVTPPIGNGVNSCGGPCAPDGSNLTLRRVVTTPSVFIGDVEIPARDILFAGLAPQFVGLYQVNVTLPANVPIGNAVSVIIRQANRNSRQDLTMAISR